MGHDLDVHGGEGLQGDAARDAQRGGEAAREVAAARDVVVVAVANKGRVIGVAGARHAAQVVVVLAAGVGVLDDGREGRAAGVAVDEAREDARAVGLAAGGRGVGAAGRAALEKGLQLVEVDLDTGG